MNNTREIPNRSAVDADSKWEQTFSIVHHFEKEGQSMQKAKLKRGGLEGKKTVSLRVSLQIYTSKQPGDRKRYHELPGSAILIEIGSPALVPSLEKAIKHAVTEAIRALNKPDSGY